MNFVYSIVLFSVLYGFTFRQYHHHQSSHTKMMRADPLYTGSRCVMFLLLVNHLNMKEKSLFFSHFKDLLIWIFDTIIRTCVPFNSTSYDEMRLTTNAKPKKNKETKKKEIVSFLFSLWASVVCVNSVRISTNIHYDNKNAVIVCVLCTTRFDEIFFYM